MIVDTSALLAYFDADEPDHDAVSSIDGAAEPLVVSPYVVAELDYLVASRLDVPAELAVLLEVAGGAWDLAAVGADELSRARAVIERHDDQPIGVADASNFVLADRNGTKTIVTLDRRHFEVLRALDGGRFTLLP